MDLGARGGVRLWRILALGLLTAAGLLAGAPPAGAQTEPLRQRVNIYLIDVSEFDVGTGHFKADFYVTFHCNRACDPHFDFRNGAIESSEVRLDTGTEKEYRVRVELQEQRVNLRRFPFTKGTLPIVLEDDLLDETHMLFEVEPGSALDTQVHLPGFEIDHDVKATVRSHTRPSNATPLALAFFGSALTGKAPHTDYVTLADAYVISSLFLLTLGLGGLIYIYDRRRGWDGPKVARVNVQLRRAISALWALCQVAFVGVVAS